MARLLSLPKLSEPATCGGPCKHTDCAALRANIGFPCVTCKQPDLEHAYHSLPGWPRNQKDMD